MVITVLNSYEKSKTMLIRLMFLCKTALFPLNSKKTATV